MKVNEVHRSRGRRFVASVAAVGLFACGSIAYAADPAPGAMTSEEIVAFTLSKTSLPTADPATVPRAFGKPDFSGMWKQEQGVLFSDPTPGRFGGAHPGWDDSLHPPPHTPAYAARYEAFKSRVKAEGPNKLYNCDPSGMPRLMANPFPMELAQMKDRLLMLFEYKSQLRRAYMDGRPHPSEDDYDASYTGHSTAKWEGETLVIDTTNIGVFPGKLLQGTGIEHSDKLHIVERVRFLTPNRIEWELTFIDPEAFAKPWVIRRSFARRDPKIDVPEYECTTREVLADLGYDGLPPPAPAKK